jgi:hypothetical protein
VVEKMALGQDLYEYLVFFLSASSHNSPESFIAFAIWLNLRHRASVNNALNLSKTERNLLHIRNRSVPRSKHFPQRL